MKENPKKIRCLYPGCSNEFDEFGYSGQRQKTCSRQHSNWLRNLRRKRKKDFEDIATDDVRERPKWSVYIVLAMFILSLSSIIFGGGVTVEWDANSPSDNVLGYFVYYGDESRE